MKGWKSVERLHRRFAEEQELAVLEELVRRAQETVASLEGVERTRAEFYLRKMERDLRKWAIRVRQGGT